MALRRPTSLLVFGILHITLGCLGVLLGICGGVSVLTDYQKNMQQSQQAGMKASADPQQREMAAFQERMQTVVESTPFYKPQQIAALCISLFLCVLLIVGGIGLIRVARWARPVSLTYAVLSILSTVLNLIYTFAVALPCAECVL